MKFVDEVEIRVEAGDGGNGGTGTCMVVMCARRVATAR
jgi:GTPase involved in cell partitioning and DNA repair